MGFVTIFVRNKNVSLRCFRYFSLQARKSFYVSSGARYIIYTPWRIAYMYSCDSIKLLLHWGRMQHEHAYPTIVDDRRRSACRRRRPVFYVVDAGMQIVIIRRDNEHANSSRFFTIVFFYF